MRGQIIEAVYAAMAENPDVFFLTADMGINLVEKFGEAYPERYLNVGIAEQNLVGVSAGLANLGYRPFAYTISNFCIHRCYEQIRNDIAIHGHPITLLGTSTGYDNAPLGPTHHVIDDWGALRNIPGFHIYCPATAEYAATLVDRVLREAKPAYIRIPKGGFTEPAGTEDLIASGPAEATVGLASYGPLVQECLAVQKDHTDPLRVLAFNRLFPLEEKAVRAALSGLRHLLVVEDHMAGSGLFGLLAETCQRLGLDVRLHSLAPDHYMLDVGTSPAYFWKRFGLDAEGITSRLAALG